MTAPAIPAGEFLFDSALDMGRYRTYHIDPATHRHTITTHQFVPKDLIADVRNSVSDYGPSRWAGDWHHVANIPLNIMWQLKQQGIWDDEQAMKKWLNDPDNAVFRVKPGRV